MNFLSLIPIFSTLIDRIFPDKEKAAQAQIEMQKVLNEAAAEQAKADAAIVESKSKVIVAEAQSESWAARNWRPHLMYSIMIMMLYNWMIAGILRSLGFDITIIPIPNDMWTLLSIGVGGYVVGKSGENIMTTYANAKFNNQKFFEVLRNKLFKQGLTQDQVDVINEALSEARK